MIQEKSRSAIQLIGRDDTLTAAFELAAKKHRDRPAFGADCWQPSYDELNATANRLAHALLRRDSALGDRVAIVMQDHSQVACAILAGLKAGKIIVTLNPAHPPIRLIQLLADAEPAFLVADSAHRELAAAIAPSGCSILTFDEEVSEGPTYNPSLPMAPETAFLVYTSGTTGHPKGVMETHAQRLHAVGIHTAAMGYTADDRITLFASLGTGQGTNMMFVALLNGSCLCPFSLSIRGTTKLAAWVLDQGITVYSSSASIFRHFMMALDQDVRFPLVRAVRLSSEAATSSDFALFQRHFPKQCKFVHMLSASETSHLSVFSCTASDEVPAGRIGVGAPSNGNELMLLNENGHPVEPGEVGEIVVRSRYLAAGYWHQPALTAERFSGDAGGMRQFRTRDLGRINSMGMLEYVGRLDSLVKICGNRVDLTEVETALRKLARVKDAAVDSTERNNHEHFLTGYVVVERDHSWSEASLRIALRRLVPDYMVPSAFVLLDSFPQTSSGKIDREQLRQLCPLGQQALTSAPRYRGRATH